jgi:His/Glu/Gln/Arg/opine family amino acid ABC transporter permease subunit
MMPGGFDWSILITWAPEFVQGAIATLWISFFSLLLALVVGLLVGLMRISHSRILCSTAKFYVDLIRGTPVLIQIFAIYFGLPFFGVRIPAQLAGVLSLGLNSGAYIAEMIRGALEAVEKGQMEAARSLGMSNSQAMRRIILPQTFRVVIPPITGEYNSLVKGSSLLSVVSVGELTRVGQRIIGLTFRPVEAWVPVAAIYFLINFIITRITNELERRLSIGQSNH